MAPTTKIYDLIILGAGPAGITAAVTAIANDKTVALIDSHHNLGGEGYKAGTIPSKALRETALAMSGLKARNLARVDLTQTPGTGISDLLTRNQNVRSTFNETVRRGLSSKLAEIFLGDAKFVDSHTVRVAPLSRDGLPPHAEPVLLHGKNILIATGSSPIRPAIFPFAGGHVFDSDTVAEIQRIPKTMAIVGAGVIGSEYGCTFTALGTKVHIIDVRDRLLPFMDGEVSAFIMAAMEKSGMVFHWKASVLKCDSLPGGEVSLALSSGKSLQVETVLVATGRKGNTYSLDLLAAGIQAGEFGIIPVDQQFRTKVLHILAAGDVIGFPALASTSMEQARRAVTCALGLGVDSTPPLLPHGIYTIPEASMVGATEESLRNERVDFVVGRARYVDNARGQLLGDEEGFLKLLVRRENMQVLGVHIVGEQATELIHLGLMAMENGSPVTAFSELCFNVPTLGSLYKTAALDALRQIGEGEWGLPSFY